ncbi:MAG: hypothetical protein HDS84_04125 [Bacteroidales bacterium]|nr:hypothetical protein [Bacteroidales bacterium]
MPCPGRLRLIPGLIYSDMARLHLEFYSDTERLHLEFIQTWHAMSLHLPMKFSRIF